MKKRDHPKLLDHGPFRRVERLRRRGRRFEQIRKTRSGREFRERLGGFDRTEAQAYQPYVRSLTRRELHGDTGFARIERHTFGNRAGERIGGVEGECQMRSRFWQQGDDLFRTVQIARCGEQKRVAA